MPLTEEAITASQCINCGGIPQDAALPFWVFDEYDCCSCPVFNEDKDDELYETKSQVMGGSNFPPNFFGLMSEQLGT